MGVIRVQGWGIKCVSVLLCVHVCVCVCLCVCARGGMGSSYLCALVYAWVHASAYVCVYVIERYWAQLTQLEPPFEPAIRWPSFEQAKKLRRQ